MTGHLRNIASSLYTNIVNTISQEVIPEVPDTNQLLIAYREGVCEILGKYPSFQLMSDVMSTYSCEEISQALRDYVLPLQVKDFHDGKAHLLEKCPFDLNMLKEVKIKDQRRCYELLMKWCEELK